MDIVKLSIESRGSQDSSVHYYGVHEEHHSTLFNVEKHLSASAVDMGVVIIIFSSVTVSENTSDKLLSTNN